MGGVRNITIEEIIVPETIAVRGLNSLRILAISAILGGVLLTSLGIQVGWSFHLQEGVWHGQYLLWVGVKWVPRRKNSLRWSSKTSHSFLPPGVWCVLLWGSPRPQSHYGLPGGTGPAGLLSVSWQWKRKNMLLHPKLERFMINPNIWTDISFYFSINRDEPKLYTEQKVHSCGHLRRWPAHMGQRTQPVHFLNPTGQGINGLSN